MNRKIEGRGLSVRAVLWPCLVLMVCLSLSGCGSTRQNPPEIGTGTDDLKASICEGCKMKPFYRNGQWLIEH